MDNNLSETYFNNLYNDYFNALLHLCIAKGKSQADAEEIVSKTFHRLWQKWGERKKYNALDNKKWLYVTVGNVIKEFSKMNKKLSAENIEDYNNTLSDENNIDLSIETSVYRDYLTKTESLLDEDEKLLFRLAFIDKITYPEIMKVLNINNIALRSRISRLRTKLRPIINNLIIGGCDKS